MRSDVLTDDAKKGWRGKQDPWWYFQQMVIKVNEMDKLIADNKDPYNTAIELANFAVIAAKIQEDKLKREERIKKLKK